QNEGAEAGNARGIFNSEPGTSDVAPADDPPSQGAARGETKPRIQAITRSASRLPAYWSRRIVAIVSPHSRSRVIFDRGVFPSGVMLARVDLEPLFFAPFVSSVMRVEPGWIDYNGHLNMAYYNVLFDRAVDEAFELLGCGLDYVKSRRHSCFTAEVHVRYLRELNAEDPVRVTFQLLDYDTKRMHYFEQLFHA